MRPVPSHAVAVGEVARDRVPPRRLGHVGVKGGVEDADLLAADRPPHHLHRVQRRPQVQRVQRQQRPQRSGRRVVEPRRPHELLAAGDEPVRDGSDLAVFAESLGDEFRRLRRTGCGDGLLAAVDLQRRAAVAAPLNLAADPRRRPPAAGGVEPPELQRGAAAVDDEELHPRL